MRSLSSLKVNLKHLENNLELIHILAGTGKKLLPMLKAQAYGHGALPVAKKILSSCMDRKHILEGFGFATLFEAYAMREQLQQCPVPLYVFSELALCEKKEWYEQWGFIPVLSHKDDLQFFLSEKIFAHVPLVLKFNSGMNRLGFNPEEQDDILALLKKYHRRTIYHLMSHFACSYIHSHLSVEKQQQVMEKIKENFYKAHISIEHFSFSNSGAIEQKIKVLDETVVRPGLMLYGPRSVDRNFSFWKGKIISQWETTIIDVRTLKKGESFGYGLTAAPEDGVLLILPLGYADGIQFGFNGFSLKHEGVDLRFFARPNMDLCYLWTTNSIALQWKNKKLALWNHENDNLQLLSDHNQTITYQILTAISSRVPRDYVLE